MFFSANLAFEQEIVVVAITIAIFIFTRFWYTPTHVQSKSSSDFALWQPLLKHAFYKMYARIGRGPCCWPTLERLLDVWSW